MRSEIAATREGSPLLQLMPGQELYDFIDSLFGGEEAVALSSRPSAAKIAARSLASPNRFPAGIGAATSLGATVGPAAGGQSRSGAPRGK
jgi:hypothetical protein